MSAPGEYTPRLIAWELTRSCPLACKHCRASAGGSYEGELATDECFRLLDSIAAMAKPIIILTGGEPLLRADICDIAARAVALGLRCVLATCGAPLDDAMAGRIKAAGVEHISVSIDGASAETHDEFRGVEGAFESALRGIEAAKRAGVGFQINTTVTAGNVGELDDIRRLAIELGASVFNPFLLVPTGRGKQLAGMALSAEQYEQTLHRLAAMQADGEIPIRVTCAPHYQRIVRQLGLESGHGAGCMGGKQFAFISHRGKVQICGFLECEAGDVRSSDFDFAEIWRDSQLFAEMRDPSARRGKCGRCEFLEVCGGCRARARAMTGDYLAAEPLCLYQPRAAEGEGLDESQRGLLAKIQTDFPIVARPFDELAGEGGDGAAVLEILSEMLAGGVVRRLGAVFESRRLGYVSTLVAAQVPPDRLEAVAAAVSDLPGVTHNYRRQHEYNLWFTLTCESQRRQDEILADLSGRTGVELNTLPALAVYKIRMNLPMGAGEAPPAPAAPAPAEAVALDEDQKALVRLLQESLPLTDRPFDELAERIGWPVERVLEQVSDWRRSGVIRRFGAIVNHRRAGFVANGMAVFRIGDDRIDQAGRRAAKRAEVSHCFRRRPAPGFDYNLFVMVHGRSVEQVRAVVAEIVADIGPCEHDVLFSTHEYKKTSMKYFS